MTKTQTRTQIKSLLKNVSGQEISEKSRIIGQKTVHSPLWKKTEILLAYVSFQKEVDTHIILEKALLENKDLFIPRINKDNLEFYKINSLKDLKVINQYGIKEPENSLPMFSPSMLNNHFCLVIAPGLAFDRQKNRLGRGKAYYDRFISSIRKERNTNQPIVIGICFDLQLLSRVPHTQYDEKMDMIITEKEIL